MLKIFLSSTFRDLFEHRANILGKLDGVFEGVGMEKFIPDGSNSQEVAIRNLKESDVVIFLISPYYGTLLDVCSLKGECKAECPMKTGNDRISYTHCEYKTAISEGILHQTYVFEENWDVKGVKREALNFKAEIGKEMWKPIQDLKDICNNLAKKIVEWHTKDKLDFKQFCDREDPFNELINNIDGKVEVYGVGGIGKTALIQVALLIQKLKGKKIVSIGIPKAYASGSGFESFRLKCKADQYVTDSQDEITIYDVINALVKTKLIINQEEILKKPKDELVELISKQIKKEINLTVFIDDFHLASDDVVNLVKTLDNIVLSSRRNTYVVKKEICILGIDEEDREDLINLYTISELPIKAKELIKQIAEGHPISTELLVKNYQKINFDNLTNFNLENANNEQVKEFYQRVIEEIFSTNPDALALLKDLAVLNTNLETNINREVVNQSYDINNPISSFNELTDVGMVKKKDGKEGIYEFCYTHIQDALEDIADRESHDKAVKYYEKKKEIIGEDIDDAVEILYHKVKSNPNDNLIDEFLEIRYKIQPLHYGFKQLINVGKDLKGFVKKKNKPYILGTLGKLYKELGRFKEAETAYQEELEIFKELAEKNPEAYKPDVAGTQNNLGVLHYDLKRFEEAETAYQEALDTYKALKDKNPDAYMPTVATTQNNLGVLYADLGRFVEAETAYTEALDIRKELADKNPDAYMPFVAATLNNLGILYTHLGRFAEAETAYTEALGTCKELADKNPDAYMPNIAGMQNNLGVLYVNLKKFTEAETTYQEALDIRKELACKNPDAYMPDVATTQNNLGNLYSKLKRFEEAEIAFREALEIYNALAEKNPDMYNLDIAGIQNNLGILYSKLKWFEEAENAYHEALKVYPKYYGTWYNKACLESLKNLKEQSIESLKKAIELDKKFIEMAKSDEDFDNIRTLKEFKELIGE